MAVNAGEINIGLDIPIKEFLKESTRVPCLVEIDKAKPSKDSTWTHQSS
ncbi:hypothetical protein CCACVL1_15979 [Corchorus capsularis]|uniref:Uncharacterized protein n=1 Tax=Corchorus capsularis TaxID=210143 RepID=A0A1R3I027_COCAP|nr:hypothetical protein CCACVL1_15979 [Corchorus capsularis]